MTYYIIRSDGAYVEFEGMTQDQISQMLSEQGLSCEFIDEQTYRSRLNNG